MSEPETVVAQAIKLCRNFQHKDAEYFRRRLATFVLAMTPEELGSFAERVRGQQ